jgi:hypothetical protein
MILNKLIMHKPTVEGVIGEGIAVIYQLDGMTKIPVKCDYDTKVYTLDKQKDYLIVAARHNYRIEQGQLFKT